MHLKKPLRRAAAALTLALVLGQALPRALALAPQDPGVPAPETEAAEPVPAMIGGGGGPVGGGGGPDEGEQEPPGDPSGVNEDGSIRWKEVSGWEELSYWGEYCQYLKLTGDILLESGVDLQFFPLYTGGGGNGQTLNMGDHHITVPAGSSLYFGGNGFIPFALLGDGGADGLFRVEAGGLLHLGGMDCSQTTGLLAAQPEGAWLSVKSIDCAPGQLSFARSPVVRPWYSAGGFFLAEAGISPEELESSLSPFSMEVNYQGEDGYFYAGDDPAVAGTIVWGAADHAEEIAAGTRTALSARAAGPIPDGIMPQDAPPILLRPVCMEVAFLVDGAAITEINTSASNHSCMYYISCQYPEQALPEGEEQPWPLTQAVAQVSLDDGGSWLDIPSTGEDVKPEADLSLYFTGDRLVVLDLSASHPYLVRFRMDYQGEAMRYRLYTDTLLLSPDRSPVSSDIGGSRGGSVDLFPPTLPPDPGDSGDDGGGGTGGESQQPGQSDGPDRDDGSSSHLQPTPSPSAQSALAGPAPGLFLDRTDAPSGGASVLEHAGDSARPLPVPGTDGWAHGGFPDVEARDDAPTPDPLEAPDVPDASASGAPEQGETGSASSQPGEDAPAPPSGGGPSVPDGPGTDTDTTGSSPSADRVLPSPGIQIALGAGITAALLAAVLLWRGRRPGKK